MTRKLADVLAERSNATETEERAKKAAADHQREVQAEARVSDMKTSISDRVRALHQACHQSAALTTSGRQMTYDEDFPSTKNEGRYQGEIEAIYSQIAEGAAQRLRAEDGLTVTVQVIGNQSVLQVGDSFGDVYRIKITMSW